MSDKEFNLLREYELRIQLKKKLKTEIVLLSGKAEVLGSQLEQDEIYRFSPPVDIIIPIFTWHGCTIKVQGNFEKTSIAHETPMGMYLNTHACLEKLRLSADENKGTGPITMIVGPKDVGKSSLCKILLNYAVREGRTPVFADVDVGQGTISIPSSIGAAVIENEICVENELGLVQEVPLVFSFGRCSPSSTSHYKMLVSKLGETIRGLLTSDEKASRSGVIINTYGWVQDDGYKLLLHAAQAFEVDIILVIDDDKLYNDFNQDIPFVKVHFLPKSDGIISTSTEKRHSLRESRLLEYFHGHNYNIESHTIDVAFSELQIYEISTAVEQCGSESVMKIKIIPVEISKKLKQRVLAVSLTSEVDDLVTSPVVGFICLLRINMEEKMATVLSPQPKLLLNAFYILTHLDYPNKEGGKKKKKKEKS